MRGLDRNERAGWERLHESHWGVCAGVGLGEPSVGGACKGDWPTAFTRGRFVRVRLGLSAQKATNDIAFRFTPGILLAGNRSSAFMFGIKAEVAAPVSIDLHDRVSLITGGAIPFSVYINNRNIGAAR